LRGFCWRFCSSLRNTASYTFLLALLPIALLLLDARTPERLFLIVTFFALCFPLRPGWSGVFPKLWVLGGDFYFCWTPILAGDSAKNDSGAAGLAALVACASARRHTVSHAAEPGQRYDALPRKRMRFSLAHQRCQQAACFISRLRTTAMCCGGFTRERSKNCASKDTLSAHLRGIQAAIYFELVAHGTSTEMAFDPATRRSTPSVLPAGVSHGSKDSVRSPDGKWIAFMSDRTGAQQIWLRNAATGKEQRVTGGNCNSAAPSWDLDSSAIIFASDCGRGIGLPALYRARIPNKVE